MKSFFRFATRKPASAKRPRVRLTVEALDRILLSSGPSLVGHVPAIHGISGMLPPITLYQAPMLQAPNLTGQTLSFTDPVGNSHGILLIRTQNSDGSFCGDFNGVRVTGFITFDSIQFSGDSATPFGYDKAVGLPTVQTHHVGYSGSLYHTAAGYATSGWVDDSTALCWENEGVCTYIAGTRQDTTFSVSGTFALSDPAPRGC
jgi:hypothetical protein